MAKREEPEFGEFMAAHAAPVPVFGWPELDVSRFSPSRPSLLVSLGGLALGLAIGFWAAWPHTSIVYPGTQVAAWMGQPSAVLESISGQPIALQSTGQPAAVRSADTLQATKNTQLTNFRQDEAGYLDQVGGQFLQGTQNIPPVQ